jgi:hypothetical protein
MAGFQSSGPNKTRRIDKATARQLYRAGALSPVQAVALGVKLSDHAAVVASGKVTLTQLSAAGLDLARLERAGKQAGGRRRRRANGKGIPTYWSARAKLRREIAASSIAGAALIERQRVAACTEAEAKQGRDVSAQLSDVAMMEIIARNASKGKVVIR